MNSPTLELIANQRMGNMTREVEPQSEVERLRIENRNLRRKLAHLTAQYVYTEGGSHAKIDQEIRQYGFRLASMKNGYDPIIVPITKVVMEVDKQVIVPVVDRRAGRLADPYEGRS